MNDKGFYQLGNWSLILKEINLASDYLTLNRENWEPIENTSIQVFLLVLWIVKIFKLTHPGCKFPWHIFLKQVILHYTLLLLNGVKILNRKLQVEVIVFQVQQHPIAWASESVHYLLPISHFFAPFNHTSMHTEIMYTYIYEAFKLLVCQQDFMSTTL